MLLFENAVQLRTVPLGLDNLVLPSDEARRKAYEAANSGSAVQAGGGDADGTKRKWRAGELEFEALMRRLENAVSQPCLALLTRELIFCVYWKD